jgi:predicted metalloprotease with PDZ domain
MPPLHYRISPLDVRAHLFEVTCTVHDPDPGGQVFRLPTWTPGSYLIREFARHFVRAHASCEGRAVAIEKITKDAWRAAPCHGTIDFVAEVYAYDLSVRTAYLDAGRAAFNGAAVFACPLGREEAPVVLDIDASFGEAIPGARVATAMRRDTASRWGFGRYRAASYDELIDHPVEIGRFVDTSFTAGGATHDVVVTGSRDVDLARLAGDLARICQWQCGLFDVDAKAPFDHYVFLVMAVGEGYGGLEHRASTSLLCKRDELPRAGEAEIGDDYLRFLGLASHEYFHAWNVKRIKPSAFVPYDLAREAYTRQLWAFEGITSYYDDLSLSRSGVVSPARVLECFARTLTGVLRTPGRALQSLAESSFDAWIKFYRPDENSANAGISYYAKGAIVALALDLELRRRGASLDELMRELWRRHGAGGGVDEDGIAALAVELGGADLREFFARHVSGTDDPPLADLFANFGVTLTLRSAEGPRDRGGKPEGATQRPASGLGASWTTIGELRLTMVHRDAPASRAGLSANDVVVAIDGLKATPEALTNLLTRTPPGTHVAVTAFRRDVLMQFDVVLDPAPADTAVLTLVETVDDVLRERRAAWLGG